MIIDFRNYRPADHVNDLGAAMSYAADYAGWHVARDLLAEAEAEVDRLGTAKAPQDDRLGYVRLLAEYELAKVRRESCLAALAQAERTLATYPAEIKLKAEARDWCPIPADLAETR